MKLVRPILEDRVDRPNLPDTYCTRADSPKITNKILLRKRLKFFATVNSCRRAMNHSAGENELNQNMSTVEKTVLDDW